MAEGNVMPLTAADVAAVTRNDGCGYGNGAWGGEWFWIIIILFAFWGNNGWGNNNDRNCATTDFVSSEFTQRDIFNTNQNVSTTGAGISERICDTKYDLGTALLENRYTNQLGVQSIISSQKDCCLKFVGSLISNGKKKIR